MSVVVDNFLRYVVLDTQSRDGQEAQPSTEGQFDLARMLLGELKEIGAADARLDDRCYLYARLPATKGCEDAPTLGFVAHMDTSPAVSGKDVKPRIVRYNGGDITLNEQTGVTLSPSEYPSLLDYIGQDLIVTDGSTLLGADDKAGIAEIMAMARYLQENPNVAHGNIVIAFTPDEEVARGVDGFDVKGFGADFAYTVDGGKLGELEYENFNAANLSVTINGINIHPGSAKGKMKNALLIAMELQAMLPAAQNPALTEGYEGFYHLDELNGNVEKAVMVYIIRDHDKKLFEQKKDLFLQACAYLNKKYGKDTVVCNMADVYYNMCEQLQEHMHLIENARAAMEKMGITPIITPIRGGTDGSRLSYMGLPCPNLGTGGHNFHGRYEYIPTQSMERTVELLLAIAECYRAPMGKKA